MLSFYIVPSLDTHNTKFTYGEAPERSWYYEFVTGKQDLLITVGDSWTWGDSLGQIDFDKGIFDDITHRTSHVFGRLLADKLNRDFLMLAKCGATNSEIHRMAFGYIDQIKSKYRKITVVQWILARNFTVSYPSNISKFPYMLKKTWVDILAEAQEDKSLYPQDARIVSQLGFVPLEEYLQKRSLHRSWRRDLYGLMSSASLAIDWLMDSDLNYKKATKHPTERGHELWADYLYDIVKG